MHKVIPCIPRLGTRPTFRFIENTNAQTVEFDFSKCDFLEPADITALACCIEEYQTNGVDVVFTGLAKMNLKTREYLQSTGLLEYWGPFMDRDNFVPASTRQTTFSLWQINPSMISSYASSAQGFFGRNMLEDKNLEPLNLCLTELFNNIQDHALSMVSGFCLSQYYPNAGRLKISVCDYGIGIPRNIKDYIRKTEDREITEEDAVFMSMERGFSTKSTPHNRGFGLPIVKDIVGNNNGELVIVSNKCLYSQYGSRIKVTPLSHNFEGTHISINLNANNFESKDNEEDMDFLDF